MVARARCELVLLPALLLAACGATATKESLNKAHKVWPEPPDLPRIQLMGEFSSASDLGIRPTFVKMLLSFSAGSASESMVRPMAVVASEDGKVLHVADPGAQCVHRFDLHNGRYDCLKADNKAEPLVSPVGLAITAAGWVFATDSRLAKLYRLAPGEKVFSVFDVGVTLEQPTGITWSAQSNWLYVTDTGSQSIKVVDMDGRLVSEFGRRGSKPGEFNFPTYLWADRDGEILVTDSLNFRVQRFTARGSFISAFGEGGDLPGSQGRPKGVATDSFGHVYVADGMFHAMQIFSGDGELLLAIGRRGQGPGEFWLPAGLFIDKGNRVYVADSYNKRVQVFRYVGEEQ